MIELLFFQEPDAQSPSIVIGPHHRGGAEIAQTLQADCDGEPVTITWWAGHPRLWVTRAQGSMTFGAEESLVAEAFGPRVQPVSFWMRCEADGIVTLGFRLVRNGTEAPEFASGVAEFDRRGAILSYTGLETEPAERFNSWLDRPE